MKYLVTEYLPEHRCVVLYCPLQAHRSNYRGSEVEKKAFKVFRTENKNEEKIKNKVYFDYLLIGIESIHLSAIIIYMKVNKMTK